MRTLTLVALLPLLWLCGCAALTPVEIDWRGESVMVELLSRQADDVTFTVKVRFYEDTDLPGLVQEVRLPGGRVCVEYFDCPGGSMPLFQHDTHWGPADEGMREMLVYPAEVEGADLTSLGFAMLADNGQGLATNVGPDFNKAYQARHSVRGRVKAARRDLGVVWRIWSRPELRVEIPAANRL